MIHLKTTTPLPFLGKVNAVLSRIPGVFAQRWQRRQGAVRSYAKRTLKIKPGRPHYPIRWTSERQRKAFFASDGFGRGIPTRRTDAMINAWDVKFTATTTGGLLTLINNTDYAGFVVGDDQQGFHADTGWYKVEDKTSQISNYAADTLSSVWLDSSDPFAGVPQR